MPSSRSSDDRLRLFCERVDTLLQRRALRDGTIRSFFQVQFGKTESTITFDIGDQEDFRSLMLEVRKFLSDREDVFFNRIANDLERRLTDAELKEANRTNRETWKRVLDGSMAYMHGTKRYNAIDFYDLVVNGELFHSDQQKAQEFEQFDEITKAMALSGISGMVIGCVKVLIAEANLIQAAVAAGHLTAS